MAVATSSSTTEPVSSFSKGEGARFRLGLAHDWGTLDQNRRSFDIDMSRAHQERWDQLAML